MLARRIDRTEVQKERHEENECSVLQKANGRVQVFVSSYGLVKMEDESRQTERRKMQYEGSASALFEEHEEAYE